MKTLALGVGLASALMMTGCNTLPVSFSDKSIPAEQGKYSVIGDEVSGESYQCMIFGLGFSMPGSEQRRAYKNAISKTAGTDGLISMAIDCQLINLGVAQLMTTRVTGTPIKLNK